MKRIICSPRPLVAIVLLTSCGTGATDPLGRTDAGAPSGCLAVTVRRAPGDSQLPWIKAPARADGIGTLVASAVQAELTKARATVAADMRAVGASSRIELGCPGPGAYVVRAFLDDNGDATAEQVISRDDRDACGGGGVPETADVTVEAGQVAEVELVLYQSCDPNVD